MKIYYDLIKMVRNFVANPAVTTGMRQDPYFGPNRRVRKSMKIYPPSKKSKNVLRGVEPTPMYAVTLPPLSRLHVLRI